jgi:hypothetical protein
VTDGHDLPIACTLTEAELRAGADGLLPGLIGGVSDQVEVPDGVALRFDPTDGLLERLASVIERERRCCAFLRFRVTVEPGGGPIWMEITGPPGTREFLLHLAGSDGSVRRTIERTEQGGVP